MAGHQWWWRCVFAGVWALLQAAAHVEEVTKSFGRQKRRFRSRIGEYSNLLQPAEDPHFWLLGGLLVSYRLSPHPAHRHEEIGKRPTNINANVVGHSASPLKCKKVVRSELSVEKVVRRETFGF
jgi:hypothetical protein